MYGLVPAPLNLYLDFFFRKLRGGSKAYLEFTANVLESYSAL